MRKHHIPANAPPPLTIAQCTTRRIQKDAADVKPIAKKLTFDDLETAQKAPIRTRQGDSMTTSVNKVVNTPIITAPAKVIDGTCRGLGANNFAPIPQNYGRVSSDRQIAQLPEDFKGNPHAVVIDAPQEVFRGLKRQKRSPQMPTDMNAVLPCGNGYASIKASDLVNPNYKAAPPLVY